MLGDHQDVWSADTSPIRELLKDASAISDEDAFLERPRQTLEGMKIEVPLILDQMPLQSGPSGPDNFDEFVEAEMGLVPEFERAVLYDLSDGVMEEQFQKSAKDSMRFIEQEQLQAIDAIGRVPIPVMDFLIPEPEWKRLCGSGSGEIGILKWIQAGKQQLFKPLSWPADRAAERKMVWSPITPKVAAVPENEDMKEGEPVLEKYLELPRSSEVTTSLDCIHHRGAPVVFEDDDRDEDIETQLTRTKPTVDFKNAVRKRVMDTNTQGTPKKPRHTIDTIEQTSLIQTTKNDGPFLLPGDSPGASGSLLANFMEVHAPKKRVWTNSKYFASAQTRASSLPASTQQSTKQDNMQILEKSKTGVTAPCPNIEPPNTALTVFISIRVPRRMIRFLESIIPDLTLLERDYDAHNTFIWKPGSVVRTEVVPSLADDADITVSPSTGLIVTSMIRVRQKPRTGTSKSTVQIRVEKASLRHERLILLVGGEGGRNDTCDAMSSSDSTALLELHGFVSGLECNIQVHYVGGGDRTLANWVAACICRHGVADLQTLADLNESETLWEVFLRRAGFNVFAAQAVASHFKSPSNESDVTCSPHYGLGAFMTMTRDERMRQFGQLVGTRVLERVSRNVDGLWNRS